ncbi:MAG: hypothetical protein HS128_12435 [Ideonella sp.]|nr:hypothetical protein [Ideonella sp.]
MTTINDAFINALLADASYVDALPPELTGPALAERLTLRMTPSLATFIGQSFTVIKQAGGFASGFEATIWRGNAGTPYASQTFVSMRGTQELAEDLSADADLMVSGLATDQLVDMVNWWLRETTPASQSVAQIVRSPVSQHFASGLPAQGTGGLVGIGAIKSVNGHSLGGYLATAFSRIFGAGWPIEAVNTFNSAGFRRVQSGNIDVAFAEIAARVGTGLSLAGFANAQNNYYAVNGVNFTTNDWDPVGFQQYGVRIGLYQEDKPDGPAGFLGSHPIYKLTGVLALGAALERLDPSMDFGRLGSLVSAGSNDMSASYESVLDGVRRVLAMDYVSTPVGDVSGGTTGPQPQSRVALHQTLVDLQASPSFGALLGKLRLDPSSGNLAAKARNDFAALASLITLSPVVLAATDGNQGALDATLRTVWGQTYLDWEADKSMPQADRDAGMLTFSDQWIADRALLVAAVGLQNQRDIVTGQEVYDSTVPAGKRYEFQYYGGTPRAGETQPPLQTLAYARTSQVTSPQFIAFGDDTANLVQGTPNLFADHLYGAAGNDSITGLAGADHLEGNAGADTLDGGSGNDTLLGGTDDDFLEGSTGADTLLGGAGSDTYFFNTAGWGDDVIIDSDGQGSLRVPGYDAGLPQGKRQPNGKYETPTQDVTYTVQQITPTRKDLYIEFANRADTITIRNWSPGALGITLDDSIAPLVPNYVDTGDAQPNRLTAFHDPDGAGPLEGEYVRDVSLAGGQGDDTVLGYIGNDILQGGAGSDIVLGEASVIVVTSPPAGEPGDDRIFGDGEVEIDSAIAQGNVQTPSGVKGDWLGGEDGDDAIVGSAGHDVLMGGRGSDLLVGGAGDDDLNGDDDYAPGSGAPWSVASMPGNEFDRLYDPVVSYNRADDSPSTAADPTPGSASGLRIAGAAWSDVVSCRAANDTCARRAA